MQEERRELPKGSIVRTTKVHRPLLHEVGHISNITARLVEARSEWTTLQKAL
jgi:hypothetical protein